MTPKQRTRNQLMLENHELATELRQSHHLIERLVKLVKYYGYAEDLPKNLRRRQREVLLSPPVYKGNSLEAQFHRRLRELSRSLTVLFNTERRSREPKSKSIRRLR